MSSHAAVREALKRVWGWTDEDVAKYYDHTTKSVTGTKVSYVRSKEELAKYAVKPGPTLQYGDPPIPLDTSNMLSKASGQGFAIFVMDAEGNIFAGQHKVGLFHHSSFKAGGDVAAAGEMKVTGGRLVQVTAKSGHYEPTPAQTRQLLREMDGAGLPLAGVRCKVWVHVSNAVETHVYDAQDFLINGTNAKLLTREGMM